MKKILLMTALHGLALVGFAQYHPVNEGSSIQFKVKNFGISVGGRLSRIEGDIRFDPSSPQQAAFDVTVDASTVNTDNEMRDEHLRGDSYFDVKNHPKIHFVSTQVTGNKNLTVSGKLTIKNVTKDVSIPFSVTPSGDGYQFKGAFRINRRDFDVGGSSTISDNVDISITVIAKK